MYAEGVSGGLRARVDEEIDKKVLLQQVSTKCVPVPYVRCGMDGVGIG